LVSKGIFAKANEFEEEKPMEEYRILKGLLYLLFWLDWIVALCAISFPKFSCASGYYGEAFSIILPFYFLSGFIGIACIVTIPKELGIKNILS
jgi:hypothetical protein